MEAVILCGIQATGKSSFCRERFFASHVRINLDMLKTRHREGKLLQACLDSKQPFVVDNTNVTRNERRAYIQAAREAGFRVIGYYFESRAADAITRNSARPPSEQIPEIGIKGTFARLEIPSWQEGFDELHYVRLRSSSFEILEWQDEV